MRAPAPAAGCGAGPSREVGGASELLGSGGGSHEESKGGGGGGGNDDDDAATAAAELEQQQRDGASRSPPDFDYKRVQQVLQRAGAVRLYTLLLLSTVVATARLQIHFENRVSKL